MSDVFLSYAPEDLHRVKAIVAACEARGWSVFWDRTIPAGKSWRDIIGRALDEARCVLVVWSRFSIESHWVQQEADEGRQRGILTPVLLDGVRPPMGFRDLQAAEFIDVDPANAAVRPFLADVAALLDPPTRAPDDRTPRSPDVRPRRPPPGRPMWVPVLVIVAGWAAGGAIGLALTFSIVTLFGAAFGGGLGWAIAGMVGAFTIGKGLRLVEPLMRSEHVVMFTVGWAVAAGIGGLLSWALLSLTGGIVAGGLGGAIGGWITGQGLGLIRPSLGWKGIGAFAFSWMIGGALGSALSWSFLGYRYTVAFYAAMGAAIGAAIALVGALLMLSYLRLTPTRPEALE